MKAQNPMPDVRELRLFDSCVTLGRVCHSAAPEPLTADNVLAVMDRHDIAEALVQSNEARVIHPHSAGNRRLLREIDGMTRLHPVWVLEPPRKPDPSAARAIVEEMLDAGVRAARLMMGHIPPLLWLWEDLCEALEGHYVPCLLDFTPLATATTNCVPDGAVIDKLREVCLAHPDLPLILSHNSGGLGIASATIPLMYYVSNLMIDTTTVMDFWTRAARELGPERVVFATGMPFYDPAIIVSNVQYDHRLDPAGKYMICSGNLRRLLEGVQ